MNTDVKAVGPPRRGWLRRNWLWFVPSVLVLLAVLCAGVGVGIWIMVLGAVKSTEPYQAAMKKVREDPRVIAALGEPIKDISWFPANEYRVEGDRGSAQFDFNVAGPKGKAHVRVEARRIEGQWGLLRLEATPEGGGAIKLDVRQESGGSDAPPFDATPPAEETNPPGKKKPDSEPPGTTINLPVPEP
jgi:hypothetical protein